MRKEKRKKEIRRRKNFFPTLLVILFSWAAAAAIVYFVDPASFGVVPLFFIVLLIATILTFATIFASTRRGVITALALTIFLVLRYLGIGNILNFLLILGLAISAEIYLSKGSS